MIDKTIILSDGVWQTVLKGLSRFDPSETTAGEAVAQHEASEDIQKQLKQQSFDEHSQGAMERVRLCRPHLHTMSCEEIVKLVTEGIPALPEDQDFGFGDSF